MIRVYTPRDARAAGVYIGGDESVPEPAPEPVTEPPPPEHRCLSCVSLFVGNPAPFFGVRWDSENRKWYAPWWTCSHYNGPSGPLRLICSQCVNTTGWKPCPTCGCEEEYT